MGTDTYLAAIGMFGGNFAVRGWAFCDGQLLAISQNTALFSLLGTTFGGDGRTTFALPDLRGRIALHPGNGPGLPSYRWGQRGGNYSHTMTLSQMANHNHLMTGEPTAQVMTTNQEGEDVFPNGNFLAKNLAAGGDVYLDNASAQAGVLQGVTASRGTMAVANNGGQQAFSIQNPYLGIYHEIAMVGIFPSRN